MEQRKITLKCQEVIFGFAYNRKDYMKHKDINNLVLYTKDYIWQCRKHNETVTGRRFIQWFEKQKTYDHSLEKIHEKMTQCHE